MATIIGMEKTGKKAKLILDLSEEELKNLDMNNPVVMCSKSKLDLTASTHKVPNDKGSQSIYVLLPAGLKKYSSKIPLKGKQKFSCGLVETAEGGYIIFHWEN